MKKKHVYKSFFIRKDCYGYRRESGMESRFKRIYLWYILCVNAVYRITNILLSGDYQRERKHTGRRHTVVQTEYPAVNVNMGDVEQATKLPKYLQHFNNLVKPSLFFFQQNCLFMRRRGIVWFWCTITCSHSLGILDQINLLLLFFFANSEKVWNEF